MCLRIPNQPKEVAVYIYTNGHAHSAYHMHIVEYITIQCIRKVFTALQNFFHMLLCYSRIPKLIIFIFFVKFYTQYLIMIKLHFGKYFLNKNEKNTIH